MPQTQIRTTVYLDENLYLAAKKRALEERTTLTELIETGLKSRLTTSAKKKEVHRLTLGAYNLGLKNSNDSFHREEIYDYPKF